MKSLIRKMVWTGMFFGWVLNLAAQKKPATVYAPPVFGFQWDALSNQSVKYGGATTRIGGFSGAFSITTKKNRLGARLEYDYRNLKMGALGIPGVTSLNSHEFFFGLHYTHPVEPCIANSIFLRFQGGGMAGVNLDPNWRFMTYFEVIAFPGLYTKTGIVLGVTYRPGNYLTAGYPFAPTWTGRIGLMLDPEE